MPFLGSFLTEEQFRCSICLDTFDNPVSTPCGHSFCMACIGRYWHGAKLCQCPLCKESFKKKPELHINRTLREITEQFKRMKTEPGACGGLRWGGFLETVLEERTQKQGETPRDLFIEIKRRSSLPSKIKSENESLHLGQPLTEGNDSTQLQEFTRRMSKRRYTLSGAAGVARKLPLCQKHDHKIDYFCKSDKECICTECGDTDHKSHDIISAEEQWLKSQAEISITEAKLEEMIGHRMRKVEEIKFSLEKMRAAAARETQFSIRVFASLQSSIERSQAEVLEVIEMSRHSLEHQAEAVMKELELELTELRQSSAMLGKLAQTDDCISGLMNYSNFNTTIPSKDWTAVSVNYDLGTNAIYSSVCKMLQRFQEEFHKLPEICLSPSTDQSPLTPHPKVMRIQEYAMDVSLDPSTAHPRLILSEDRKSVRCGNKQQHASSNPERFDRVVCVLGREGFTEGRHYWEVEVGGKTDWDLGVASHSINRKGKITVKPSNGYWFLSLRDKTNYTFRTEPSTVIPLKLKPNKIGVFVDYEKGQVSFYDVDAKILIYTYWDTFYEAIYPFFSPCTNKSGKNDAPLIITPVLLQD